MTTPNWKPGDRVTWIQRGSLGNGFVSPQAGIVRKAGTKRITIAVAKWSAYPQPHYVQILKTVKPEKLRKRETPCAELGE